MPETSPHGSTPENASFTYRLGRLLAPREFAAACSLLVQRPKLDCWAVAMSLPESLARRLHHGSPREVGFSLSLLETALGVCYPTVVLQAQSCQLRAVLSLADGQVAEWLTSVTSAGSVTLAVDIPETGQLMVLDGACDRQEPSTIAAIAQNSARLGPAEDLADRRKVARFLSEPQAHAACLPGFDVTEVHLVMVEAEAGVRDSQTAGPPPRQRTVN